MQCREVDVMPHLYYEEDHTVTSMVRTMVEDYNRKRNHVIDLNREITRLKAELGYCQKERQRLDKKIMELTI
jgi:chromosome segregation ATPase